MVAYLFSACFFGLNQAIGAASLGTQPAAVNGTLSDQKPSNAATSKHQLLTARHSQALRRKAPSSIFTGIIELLL